ERLCYCRCLTVAHGWEYRRKAFRRASHFPSQRWGIVMNRRQFLASAAIASLAAPALLRGALAQQESPFRVKYYPLATSTGLHDIAPAPDGAVWFTGQRNGGLGRLDPRDGSVKLVDLGTGAAPHGVIIGPDGAAWTHEGGQ